MSSNTDIPRDVVLLLRDAETVLSEFLQYENVSIRARELGEEILRGFGLVRNRYHLDFQQRGGDSNAAATGQDSYDDNQSLSYGTSLASDEVSLASDYVDDGFYIASTVCTALYNINGAAQLQYNSRHDV